MMTCTCSANNPGSSLHMVGCAASRTHQMFEWLRADLSSATGSFLIVVQNPKKEFKTFRDKYLKDTWLVSNEYNTVSYIRTKNGSEVLFTSNFIPVECGQFTGVYVDKNSGPVSAPDGVAVTVFDSITGRLL